MSGRLVLGARHHSDPASLVLILVQASGLIGAQFFASTPSLAAQENRSSAVPSVFSALEGAWDGSGVLLGRPAAFQMRWETMGAGFFHLTFSNSWVNDDGNPTPVLSSHAVYYWRDSSAVGVWLDDRPQRVNLEATVTDSSVVTHWTAQAEAGRTEYLVRSSDTVVVRDFVYVNGSERPFAEATYRRRTPGPVR